MAMVDFQHSGEGCLGNFSDRNIVLPFQKGLFHFISLDFFE
jgi:hypothetical protein